MDTDKLDDEPALPKLSNLSTHASECKGRKLHEEREAAKHGGDGGDGHGLKLNDFNLKESAEMFRQYITSGPNRVLATQSGFNRLFAAWILDDDLPWVTGESPLLAELFKYLNINFALPSDTTVRNQLAHIFAELHGKVVNELAVGTNE